MKQINTFVKEFINDGYKPIKDSFSCVKNEKGDLFVKENLSLTQKRFFESVLNYRMLNFKYVVKNDNIFNEIQNLYKKGVYNDVF